MADELRSSVLKLLERYNPEGRPVDDQTELSAGLNIDSVAAMDLIMEIEDHFEIDIPINQVAELQTFGNLVELVRKSVGSEAR